MSHASSADTLAEQPVSSLGDGLGITASLACAVHCAAMPFVMAYLPALGLSFLADASFHQWMTGACLLLALVAFIPGWRSHRQWLPGMIAGAGLTIIAAAAFGQSDECCVACSPDAIAVDAQNSRLSDQGAVHDKTVCTLECCQSAAATDGATTDVTVENETVADGEVAAAQNENSSVVFRALAGWWTPFGGMLLVSAHLLNRRYTCCAGCAAEVPPGDAPAMDSEGQS